MNGLLALIAKDLRIELRTKETLASLLLLGILTLLVLSFAFEPGTEARNDAAPGALWVAVTFAAVLGLNRSFAAERENDCLQGLLLCPVDRSTIYLAKTVANFVFMTTAQVVIVPVFIFFFNQELGVGWLTVLLSLALGIFGLSAVGTLFAAIAVRTRAREVMLPLLMLPLVVPLFIAGVRATTRGLAGEPIAEVAQWLNLMVGFDLVFLIVAWMFFEFAVEE